jgi:hypothetical protein
VVIVDWAQGISTQDMASLLTSVLCLQNPSFCAYAGLPNDVGTPTEQ